MKGSQPNFALIKNNAKIVSIVFFFVKSVESFFVCNVLVNSLVYVKDVIRLTH